MTDRPATLDHLRNRCANHVTVVIIALLTLTLLSGWLVYTAHIAPPIDTEVRETGSIEVEHSFEHSAVVERENPIFPVGEPLENRDRYFTDLNPTLDGDYVYTVDAGDATNVSVETEFGLQLRAVGDNTEYWQEFESIQTEQLTVDEQSEDQLHFSVNVSGAENRVEEIERGMGGSVGTTEIAVVANTTVSGTIGSKDVEETETHALRIEPDDATYRVYPDGTDDMRVTVTEPVPVAEEYGLARTYGSILLFLLSGTATAVLGWRHHQGTLRPPSDVRDTIERQDTRRALDDWITVGQFPSEHNHTAVKVNSLEGLIDIAMDANGRAIEDINREIYFVVMNGTIYILEPEEPPEEAPVQTDERKTDKSDTTTCDADTDTQDGSIANDWSDMASSETQDSDFEFRFHDGDEFRDQE
ncbi:DUF5305 family protein [Natronococcus wangiae]|uniref:DUF5305 family protein n=1 Tax=Natronococcus wangiae TaxID=3068275 RepID=UPI00273DE4EB|nr:DUF5305 family protein [Natronococcus sp. AD5]